MAIYRFISNDTDTYFKDPADPAFDPGDTAVEVTNPFNLWPQITNPALADQPEYVWSEDPVSPASAELGEIVDFGQAAESDGLAVALDLDFTIPVYLTVFADNAFEGTLRVQGLDLLGVVIFEDEIPISGGTFDINTGLSPNDDWRIIYQFSDEVVAPVVLPIGTTIRFDLNITAMNYAQTDGTPETNPAAIQYLLELSDLPAGLTFTPDVPEVIAAP
ncbi:hypothetical protein CACET_c17800 [Clostridium aceticum]|uniref:Uncharacterized protein n=1 Tax=Clostridium aceticum TaxID=84022 RepID=A0A0D8IDC3_9CLOT|nr:hypothetical protein [Clostridium aceticum]AKL95228.1 hypothetical protein CACET_c17800 [Clostridium aceticum]KJF28089.1 hypothetical protein TZ02_05930 [Clostridium aceticum]